MTGSVQLAALPSGSWEDRVRLHLRPEFNTDVILARVGGSILAGVPCCVPQCGRAKVAGGLCHAHHKPWSAAGKPPVAEWAPSAPARIKGALPLRPCDAPGCQRGRDNHGLCRTHNLRWKHDGYPDRATWLSAHSGPPLRPQPPCAIKGCGLAGGEKRNLCSSHYTRWVSHGRPLLADFVAECENYCIDRFDLRRLPSPMQAEIAYGLQRRADEKRTRTGPEQIARLLTRLPAEAQSLHERSLDAWMRILDWEDRSKRSVALRFLIDTLRWLDDIDAGVGWDSEYDRDIWRLRRLGYPYRDRQLRFDRIAPGWLRQLVKRWCRWRLSTGIAPDTVSTAIRAWTVLAEGFPQLRRGPQALTRSILERHLANLSTLYPNAKGRTSHVSAIAGLLTTARQHGWEPGLLPTAAIYREDYPKQAEPVPRFLSEPVMAQIEARENLERFPNPHGRLLAELLMNTGLRVGDGCRLAIDCLVADLHGAPYVRYRNHKMRRHAMVPISDGLAASIAAQQRSVLDQHPQAAHLFPRPLRNPDGAIPYSPDTFRHHLHAWLLACDVRDELGRPVHVTPHQWRHTYATRLINSEVSQEAVRRLLDHATHHMTARYARLSDQTIRAKWEAARKIDVRGQEVQPPEGDLADAEWMKNNLARAKMALPNGYCALPLQQRCEFANACLTCPMFVTTAEFLPEHHRQLTATRKLIARAEADGQMRMVEMNRSVEANLVAIVHALDSTGCGGGCCSSCGAEPDDLQAGGSAS